MSKKNTYLEKRENQKQDNRQKRAAYYQALWTAWFEHRIELDKQLLTLSALAISLLMFFYKGLNESLERNLWLFAGVLFIFTIFLILITFYISSKHIEYMLNDKDKTKEKKLNSRLKKLMFAYFGTFILAVSTTFMLAVLSVFMITDYEPMAKVYEFIVEVFK